MALNGQTQAYRTVSPSKLRTLVPLAAAATIFGLGLALGALPLEAAAALTLGGSLVVLVFIEPAVALAALLVVLPLSGTLSLDAGDFAVSAMEGLVALLVAAWLARGIANRDLALRADPALAIPLGLVVLMVVASSLNATRVSLVYKELVKWLELVVVFVFTVTCLRSERSQRIVLMSLFFTGAAEALYGAFQYATGRGPATFAVGEALRAYGHFEQPNPFAGYLGTILPLAAAFALQRRHRQLALAGTLAAACTALGIGLSQSRGAWMGLLVAFGAMMLAGSPASRRLLAPAVGGLLLLVLLTATNVLPGGWADRLVAAANHFGVFDVRTVELTPENFAVVERMAHWQAGWYMLLDHPVLGVGAGNYPAVYEEYSLPGWREALGHAHNYYLNMAAETGLLGAAALLALFAAVYGRLGMGLRLAAPGSYERTLIVGLLGSFLVLTIHNLFDNLLVHGMPVQVGFLLGLLALAVSNAKAAIRLPITSGARNSVRG